MRQKGYENEDEKNIFVCAGDCYADDDTANLFARGIIHRFFFPKTQKNIKAIILRMRIRQASAMHNFSAFGKMANGRALPILIIMQSAALVK